MIPVHSHQPQAVPAQAQQLERLGDAAMRFPRRIADQAARPALQPVAPHVAAGVHLPRRGQPDHGRHRGAADQEPARARGQAEDLPRPLDHLPLDIDRRMLAPAEIGIEGRRQELGQRTGRRAGAVHPAHEARVGVAGRVGQHQLAEAPVDLLDRDPVPRQWPGQRRLHRLRHWLPHRPLAHAAPPVDHVVDRAMAQRPEGLPVVRIERAAHPPAARAAS